MLGFYGVRYATYPTVQPLPGYAKLPRLLVRLHGIFQATEATNPSKFQDLEGARPDISH